MMSRRRGATIQLAEQVGIGSKPRDGLCSSCARHEALQSVGDRVGDAAEVAQFEMQARAIDVGATGSYRQAGLEYT